MKTRVLGERSSAEDAGVLPRTLASTNVGVDLAFAQIARAVGSIVLVVTGGIGLFLAFQSIPTLNHYGTSFFTTDNWNFATDKVGVPPLLVGTVEVALIAITIAFPLALATALFISEYASPKLQSLLIALVDLMAAVPSIVFGLWGRDLIMPHAGTFAMFLNRHFGPLAVHGIARSLLLLGLVAFFLAGGLARWALKVKALWTRALLVLSLVCGIALVPSLFVVHADPNAANLASQQSTYQQSAFVAGIAVSMMVLPMACAIMRQVFSQTPPGEKEAALALGATKWGMIRAVVLPFGKGGIIGGTMLALGRALGETIAVLLIINQVFGIKINILESGTSTVSSTIAAQFGEATGIQLSALLTAGFVLFLLTLAVNTVAATVVSRSRSGAQTS